MQIGKFYIKEKLKNDTTLWYYKDYNIHGWSLIHLSLSPDYILSNEQLEKVFIQLLRKYKLERVFNEHLG